MGPAQAILNVAVGAIVQPVQGHQESVSKEAKDEPQLVAGVPERRPSLTGLDVSCVCKAPASLLKITALRQDSTRVEHCVYIACVVPSSTTHSSFCLSICIAQLQHS